MAKNIIIDGSTFPIQPRDIHIGKGFRQFFGAFRNTETEASAYYVIGLCQELGGWIPFTARQIEEAYQARGHRGYDFNRLTTENWIVLGTDKKYYVTDDFVARCYKSSPDRKIAEAVGA